MHSNDHSTMNGNGTHAPPGLFSLADRTVILTGGLGGLGTVLTRTILSYGADVVVTDVPPAPKDEAEWRRCRL